MKPSLNPMGTVNLKYLSESLNCTFYDQLTKILRQWLKYLEESHFLIF